MRTLLALLLMTAMVSAAFAEGPQSGDFDGYAFSLSWQPAFCESHHDKKECKSWKAGDFAASHLVLHGLWPNQRNDKEHDYGFCNVPAEVKALDDSGNWCQMPDLNLSRATKDELGRVMPGCQSCLQNHEWYRHGTCSGMQPDEYFTKAAGFVEGIAKTKLGTLLSANVGKRVTMVMLKTSAKEAYGEKGANLRFICKNGVLTEVRMYLVKDISNASVITADMLVSPGLDENSSCKRNVLIDKFGKKK